MDLLLAPMVDKIEGIEYDKTLADIANLVKNIWMSGIVILSMQILRNG